MQTVSVSSKPYPIFEVYDDNKRVIHLKIDPETRAFRISCYDSRRVFFIDNEVFKKTEITTLLNEYSQQLGVLTKNKSNANTGEIEIEGTRYTYTLTGDFRNEINLLTRDSYEPVLRCKLAAGQSAFPGNDSISYLLFSLGWFLFLTKEQAVPAHFSEA